MHSITYRITGLMFSAIVLTVFILISLANVQMTGLFQEYLMGQHMGGMSLNHLAIMGQQEEAFLASVHQSLLWVGLIILIVGLGISYLLARSITVPLRNLSRATEQIEQGNFDQKVLVDKDDEIGHLTTVFNSMAETLATNNNMRRQLFANIAHELRTPLAIIQGNLEGMVDGVIEPSKEQLGSLHEEAVRLNRLITDLRDLSLAEVRQLALEKTPTDINQLVTRTMLMLKPMSDAKEISIETALAEGLPEIEVDDDRISQVFYNIIVNAVRYSPEQGVVKVTTSLVSEEGKQYLKIAFTDDGLGISAEDLPYIFEHFYRGDKSRDRKSGGSGIGLAIVKQLVEIHGGRVVVTSTLGEGSTFTVLLPVLLTECVRKDKG